MATLSLRVCIFDSNAVKTIQFDPYKTVTDVCFLIREKFAEAQVGNPKDYGLFVPDDEKDLNNGVWMDCNRSLQFYGFRNGDLIVYRKKVRSLKVKLLDGTVKTCMVDDSQPVVNLMVIICFKLGITNSDEYGLIRENGNNYIDNHLNNSYGTLTLKRRVSVEKERDVKMDTLRKKIKTDDEVNWIDGSRTLREQGIGEDEHLLLKRKYFFSDQNIDSHDPVQLNLLFVQARDGILNGTHPVTQRMAAVLAGYQCQIQYGDYDEKKIKTPYFVFDLKEFLPESYIKIKGIDKKILSEYAKHRGKGDLDVKLLYVKTARNLPTYGVTFFLVKEKVKGKNKLVPRLLGVNRDSILRLDEKTKEILQVWPLTTVRRWGASPNTFTLDFGDYSDEYYSVQTCESEQIANLVAGYIDIIMKKRQRKEHYGIDGEENSAMVEDRVLPLKATVLHRDMDYKVNVESLAKPIVATVVSNEPQQALLSTIAVGQQIITTIEKELFETIEIPRGIDPASLKYREERNVTSHLAAMNAATAQVVTLTSTTKQMDFTAVGDAITTITTGLPEVSKGVRTLAALTDDESSDKLLDATKKLCSAFSDLLKAAEPESKQPRQNLLNAASRVGDATHTLMGEIGDDNELLREAQDALLNMGKDVAKKTAALVLRGKSVASTLDDQTERTRAIEEATKCALSTSQLVACAKVVAPTIESTLCREQLVTAVREVSSAVESLVEFCNESCKDEQLLNQLSDAARDVTVTLNHLLHHINQFGTGQQLQTAHIATSNGELKQDQTIQRVQMMSERIVEAGSNRDEMLGTRYIIQSEYSETLQTRLINAAKHLADATALMAYAARA